MPLLCPNEFDNYRLLVRSTMSDMGATASDNDKAQAAAHLILNIEHEAGSQFLIVDELPHLFTGHGRMLIPFDQANPRWAMHLAMVYGLTVKDRNIAPKVTSWLASWTLYNGVKKSARRWCAYTPDDALYLSQYNGLVTRITGAGVGPIDPNNPHAGKLIDDGWHQTPTGIGPYGVVNYQTEDNGTHVLFADDDSGSVPFDSEGNVPPMQRTGELFKLLRGMSWASNTLGGMRPKTQVQALMIWTLALGFPDAFPTKPVILAEGAAGSGKTTLLQMIKQALVGNGDLFTASEDGLRDFWVSLLHSPLLILDNTDDVIKWLPDQLNAYVTGAGRMERRLHTNTGNVKIKPHGFVAVASQDPRSFRRGDTADRMIVLRMARRKSGTSASDIVANVASHRNQIYSEWLYYLNRVVKALELEPHRTTTARLGDFEMFAYAACRALGWRQEEVVPALMNALGHERMAFAAETDVVLDTIADWAELSGNKGSTLCLRDLFKALADTASTNNKPFVKTPQALAQRLQAPHVRLLFEVTDWVVDDTRWYIIDSIQPGPGAVN